MYWLTSIGLTFLLVIITHYLSLQGANQLSQFTPVPKEEKGHRMQNNSKIILYSRSHVISYCYSESENIVKIQQLLQK